MRLLSPLIVIAEDGRSVIRRSRKSQRGSLNLPLARHCDSFASVGEMRELGGSRALVRDAKACPSPSQALGDGISAMGLLCSRCKWTPVRNRVVNEIAKVAVIGLPPRSLAETRLLGLVKHKRSHMHPIRDEMGSWATYHAVCSSNGGL